MTSRLAIFVLLGLTACDLYWPSDPDDPRFTPDAAVVIVDAPPSGPQAILHYTFDDTLANDGTLGHAFDGTGTSIGFVAGVRGRAVAFDTTQYTSVLLPTLVPMSNQRVYTVGLWFREDAVWNSGGYTQ